MSLDEVNVTVKLLILENTQSRTSPVNHWCGRSEHSSLWWIRMLCPLICEGSTATTISVPLFFHSKVNCKSELPGNAFMRFNVDTLRIKKSWNLLRRKALFLENTTIKAYTQHIIIHVYVFVVFVCFFNISFSFWVLDFSLGNITFEQATQQY